MALWGGRFAEPTDEDLRALNDSIHFDRRMYREDVAGSVAWVRALVGAGILEAAEAERIVQGLQQVLGEFESDSFELMPGDEDIHTAVERRLTEIVGPLGGKLHTGRSRNDQVATDFRLWCMGACAGIAGQLRALQAALAERAAEHPETLMPGFTHLQPAQPIVLAHWLLGYFWMLERDLGRLEAARSNAAVLPLGSGALAGTPLAVDRDAMARELGFKSVSHNSLDSVSDRDFAAGDSLHAGAERHTPQPPGRGRHSLQQPALRLLHAGRPLQHRLQPDAAEAQRGPHGAGARQGRSAHRQPRQACWPRSRACRRPTTRTCRRTRKRSSIRWTR